MQGQFGGERPVRSPFLELAALDGADHGRVRLHDPHVVEPGALTEDLSEQVDVRLADQLSRIREAEVLRHLPTYTQQPAFAILEVNAVCGGLHQGVEKEPIARGIGKRHAHIRSVVHVSDIAVRRCYASVRRPTTLLSDG
jgi:hypothetical protein